eukprot:s1609_g3.t1
MANWHNDLNMTRPKVVHPHLPGSMPGSMLGAANLVPPAVPLVLSPVPPASCMVTPRMPPSKQLAPQRPPAAASDVPLLPTRPVVSITSPTMEDRNDPHFWQTQLDTSFSVASTVSRTPLSPSPVKVESSYVPRVAAAADSMYLAGNFSSCSKHESLCATPFYNNSHELSVSTGTCNSASDKSWKSGKNLPDVVDPYEGLRLTPINEQPFQAIASIARQAQQSLVDRFLSR